MNNSSSQAFANDVEAIRQAQHEWRLAKRREMEAKARKKQFKRSSLGSQPQQTHPSIPLSVHPQPPHVHASAMYPTSAIPVTSAAVPPHHPVQIQPGVVLPHSDNVNPAQLAAHAQTSIAAAQHVQQAHPQMHHTAIAPSPPMDATTAAATAAAAMQLHQHLNANTKRAHMALEEGTGDDPDAVAAARAAAVHAAASAAPGDPQFAQNVAAAIAQPGALVTAPSANRVEEMASEEQIAQSEAQRRAYEQLEAQRQWREAKRREIAFKKAKGAASKRGRKKARTTAPLQPVTSAPAVGQPLSSHPGIAGMNMGVTAAYVREVTAQAAVANVQQSQMAEDQPTGLYDEVHNVQNVEQMLQHSVDEGGNVTQNSTATVVSVPFRIAKATAIANPLAHRVSPTSTVIAPTSGRSGSFARRVSGIAHPKQDPNVVTTELLAASTEAALNAVPDSTLKSKGSAESGGGTAVSTEQLTKDVGEHTAQQGAGGKHEATSTGRDTAAGSTATAQQGAEGKGGEAEATENPQPTATNEGSARLKNIAGTMMGSAVEGMEGRDTKQATVLVGGESAREGAVAQSAADIGAQETAGGNAESEKYRGRQGNEEDEPVSGAQEGQASVDANDMQMPQDHEGEMKEDPQDGLEVDGGDGGEDIMTAAAWQSLDSISHT